MDIPRNFDLSRMHSEELRGATTVFVALRAHLPVIERLVQAERKRLESLPEKKRKLQHLRALEDDLYETLHYTRRFRRQWPTTQSAASAI